MSAIHDQAMHYIYKQVLERVLGNMSQAQRASLQLLVQRLLVAAGGVEYMGALHLLVVQGNDRGSARLLTLLRAAQLTIALRAPETFRLRVLVVCLPALGNHKLESHERLFNTLFMHDDVRVQLQMIEGGEVVPFSRRPTPKAERWTLARNALLLFGHMIDARPEALLGSRMHLELADALRQALAGQKGGDVVLTAMPARQRRRYLSWARRTLRQAGEQGLRGMPQCLAEVLDGLGALHAVAGTALDPARDPELPASEPAMLRVIAVDDLCVSQPGSDPLDELLGCRFESNLDGKPLGAFLDPLAITHLHEMRAQCIDPDTPRLSLRLANASSLLRPYEAVQARFAKTYGISQAQLTCALFSPFAHRGRDLERYLQCRQPDMLVALPYLHRALQGKPCPEPVKDWLVNTSGLTLAQMRAIYEGRIPPSARQILTSLARRDVQLRLLRRQPHSTPAPCKASP